MKKSLSAILVILLSLIGAKAMAAKIDVNVNRATKETTDATGDKNGGNRSCGTLKGQ
jgi:hypothetical protein